MKQTAVEWLYNKMLYIDNEYDMKLITKSEYQFKRRDIIEQAKEKEQHNIIKHSVELCKILISNPIEKSGKTPQELVDSYFSNIFKSE